MAKTKIAKNQQVNIKNKRASFDYEFIDTFTAGIVLNALGVDDYGINNVNLFNSKYKC